MPYEDQPTAYGGTKSTSTSSSSSAPSSKEGSGATSGGGGTTSSGGTSASAGTKTSTETKAAPTGARGPTGPSGEVRAAPGIKSPASPSSVGKTTTAPGKTDLPASAGTGYTRTTAAGTAPKVTDPSRTLTAPGKGDLPPGTTAQAALTAPGKSGIYGPSPSGMSFNPPVSGVAPPATTPAAPDASKVLAALGLGVQPGINPVTSPALGRIMSPVGDLPTPGMLTSPMRGPVPDAMANLRTYGTLAALGTTPAVPAGLTTPAAPPMTAAMAPPATFGPTYSDGVSNPWAGMVVKAGLPEVGPELAGNPSTDLRTPSEPGPELAGNPTPSAGTRPEIGPELIGNPTPHSTVSPELTALLDSIGIGPGYQPGADPFAPKTSARYDKALDSWNAAETRPHAIFGTSFDRPEGWASGSAPPETPAAPTGPDDFRAPPSSGAPVADLPPGPADPAIDVPEIPVAGDPFPGATPPASPTPGLTPPSRSTLGRILDALTAGGIRGYQPPETEGGGMIGGLQDGQGSGQPPLDPNMLLKLITTLQQQGARPNDQLRLILSTFV